MVVVVDVFVLEKKEIKQSKTKKRKRNLASLHLSIQTLIFFPLFVFVVVEEEFSLLRCVFNIFFFFCWKIQVFLPLKNSIRCLMWCDVYVTNSDVNEIISFFAATFSWLPHTNIINNNNKTTKTNKTTTTTEINYYSIEFNFNSNEMMIEIRYFFGLNQWWWRRLLLLLLMINFSFDIFFQTKIIIIILIPVV